MNMAPATKKTISSLLLVTGTAANAEVKGPQQISCRAFALWLLWQTVSSGHAKGKVPPPVPHAQPARPLTPHAHASWGLPAGAAPVQQLQAFPPAAMLACWDYLQPLQASKLPPHEHFLRQRLNLATAFSCKSGALSTLPHCERKERMIYGQRACSLAA